MSTNIDANAAASSKSSVVTWIWSLVCLTLLGLLAYNARMGAVSPRIANPEVSGVPRPVEFMFGADYPIFTMQLGCLIMMLIIISVCAWVWRRQPGHPYILMTIASTAIVWQDPIMNWAPYAVYNPQL
jgi:Spirocyclase AveC-like